MSDRQVTEDRVARWINIIVDNDLCDYVEQAVKTACVRCEIRKTCDCAFDPYNIDVEPGIDCLAAK